MSGLFKFRDNILSLVSIILVFFFLMLMGKKLGVGASTDIYFLSTMIIAYLGQLVQASWDAMQPYYVDLKVKNKNSANQLYVVLLNIIFLFSVTIISCYFVSVNYMVFSFELREFLNTYIFIIFFQSILLFNKKILNLEHYYASYYLVDIFIYSINIIVLLYFFDGEIALLAYVLVGTTAVASFWQCYVIFRKFSIRFTFKYYHPDIKEIIINSIKMKISAILYSSKEPILAMVFLSMGEGFLSLYNYAFKFSAAIFQVTNSPIMNRYRTEINYIIIQKKYQKIEELIRKVLLETVVSFLLFSGIFYFMMPLFLELSFGDKFNSESVNQIELIYLYITIFYLVIVFEAPYANNVTIFKFFNYNIGVNAIFAIFICLIYLLFQNFSLKYNVYLIILIIAQFINLIFFYYKNLVYIKNYK